MNVSQSFIFALTNRGHNIVHWADIGAEDIEILEYVRDNNFIVLTYDLDFAMLLSITQYSKPSVIQVRVTAPQTEYVAG